MYLEVITLLSLFYSIHSAAQTDDTQACNSCCVAGIPGIPGIPGTVGNVGEKGTKGDIGNTGAPADNGLKGDNGMQGLDGIPGKLGPPGAIGLPGANGKPGATGLPGANGEKGQKGDLIATETQPKSAFSVVFRANPGRIPVLPMKYDSIVTNIGKDYDITTGKFICQHPGTYVFQVTSTKSHGTNHKILTTIMKNGRGEVSARMEADGYNSLSTMVVLNLVIGDEVWTQPPSTDFNYYHSNSWIHCSFSGFLLYAA